MNRIFTAQELGIIFENEIHELLVQTKFCVLREKDIVRKYGQHVKGIDHILYHENYIICIQDKTLSSSIVLSTINHFINCVESISYKEEKRCIGIYLSKLGLTGPSRISLDDANTRNRNTFLHLEDMDLEHLKYKLLDLFYSNQIYIYDSEDTIYMLPSIYSKNKFEN
jgi:hypothetical protein